jgi:uncharacterized protein involved in outer membrane biogenesis
MAQTDAKHGRRRGLRILLIVVAVVILLPIVGLIGFAMLFDADQYKPQIVAAAKTATGRDLTINGRIGIGLSLRPTLEVSDVSFANAPGGSRPQMVTLKRLELQLALLPLLSRHVEVDRLVLVAPDILLETDAQGTPNWQFAPPQPASGQPAAPAAQSRGASAAPSVAIRALRIEDGQITYRDGKTGDATVLAVKLLTIGADAPDAPTSVALEASYDGTPFTLNAHLGALAQLMSGRGNLPLDVTGEAVGAQLALKGNVADMAGLSGVDLLLTAKVPDLAALGSAGHVALPALKNIALSTRITDLPGGLPAGVALKQLKLTLQQADLDGELALALAPRPSVNGALHAGRIDADALSAAMAVPAPAVAGAKPAPAPPPHPAARPVRMIPDDPLPLDGLRAVNADLTLAVGELVEGGVSYRDVTGHIVLTDGRLQLDQASASLPGGKVDLKLSLDASQPEPPLAITLHSPGLALQPLLKAFGAPAYAQGTLEVDAVLTGVGKSPHAIASVLDGHIGLALENGQIDNRLLGDTLRRINLLDTGKGGTSALRCLAVRMEAKGGVGSFPALLVDSEPARVDGNGTVRLGPETLALRLYPLARLGGTGVSVPVNVTGTFLDPNVAVDAAGAAQGAVSGLANTGTAPLGMVIGKLGGDRSMLNVPGGGGSGATCAQQLAIARGVPTPPAAVSTPATQTVNPPPAAQPAKPPKPADMLRSLFR